MTGLFLSAALWTSLAFAQNSPFPACNDQIEKLCVIEGKIPKEAREVVQCLRKNAAELSDSCKQDLERYAQTSRQSAARGGGSLGSFGGFTSLTPPLPILSYEGRFMRTMNENKLLVSSPVMGSKSSVTSVSLSGGELHFLDAPVMTTGQTLPQDLHRAEVGVQWSKFLGDKKSLGLRATVGSTGDQVFQSLRDANFSFMGTYGFPGAESDYWVALFYLANNSTIGDYIPIPGIVWIHRADHMTLVLGFPVLSLQYTPTSQQSYSFSIFGTTLTTEAAFGAVTSSQFFLQGSFNQQKYILHDRLQDRDRLTFQEAKLAVGYRAPLFTSAFGEIQVGRAFNRELYIGQKLFNTDGGLKDLENDGYVNLVYKTVF